MEMRKINVMQRTNKFKGINHWKQHAIGSVRTKKEAKVFEGI